jgi:hypothetical protein
MSPLIRRRILACATLLGFLFLVPSHFSAVEPGPVRALFDLDALETGPFPSDQFTVDDGTHITGRRVNLPPLDCGLSISNCEDLEVLNTLDGFNLQPRLSIPFDGPIDPRSATSDSIFLIYLGDTVRSNDRLERVVGIDQVVWDPSTKTLHVESDELLDQHTRYALIVTRGVLDSSGSPVGATEAFRRFRQTVGATISRHSWRLFRRRVVWISTNPTS